MLPGHNRLLLLVQLVDKLPAMLLLLLFSPILRLTQIPLILLLREMLLVTFLLWNHYS